VRSTPGEGSTFICYVPEGGAGESTQAVRAALEDDLDSARALRLLEEALVGGDGSWRAAADVLGLRLGTGGPSRTEMKKALGWRAPFS